MTNYSRSVLKSNGLHCPKIRLKKFGFSPKIVPANISKKLPAQVLSQIVFHPVFQPLAQMAHVCLHSESGYTLGFRRKIAHNGSHGETRGFPSLDHSAALCRQRNTLYSATLLYTYISRFSVNPHYQQREKSGETAAINFIPNRSSSRFSTSLTNGPRSLSQTKASTHSAL